MEHTDAGVHTVLADVERPAEHDPFGDHSERVLTERPTQATPNPVLPRPSAPAVDVPPARSGSPERILGAAAFAPGPRAAEAGLLARPNVPVHAPVDDTADDPADDDVDPAGLADDLVDDPQAAEEDNLAAVIDLGFGDLLGEAMEWQERALCAQTDPEAFFPEKGGSTREAKRICSGCEVRAECLEYALENDERFGIWGGMSERERRKQRRRAV
ncbi:Transcriptional regulator WhiB [Frankia canadensis]|uniref:Transcriptional regulator WhiB n=1 Tax=Frankia canadensis TaxID=1836972 RepID=A0A2I2L0P9_9ACTN|nr:WhiB family transcriptional regulator [Frankia canadensis]SNQ51501.1 Transcriptional regulator WhiB [Frankia canadensis]SOU58791.1 Transcriptional regulator WhiB [Frankia canadensis]